MPEINDLSAFTTGVENWEEGGGQDVGSDQGRKLDVGRTVDVWLKADH